MILILQKIDASILASRKDANIIISESFNDDSTTLFISAEMDASTLSLWQDVSDNLPDWLKFEFKDDSDDIISPSRGKPNRNYKVDIKSISYMYNRFIFTIEGWNSFLHNDSLLSSVQKVNLLDLKTPFSTLGFHALPWENHPDFLQEEFAENIPPNAKSLVRYLSSDFFPPSNVYSWILKGENKSSTNYFIKWKEISCISLAKCFTNELYNDGERCISLSGKPPRKITFGSFEYCEESFDLLQSVAKWIFVEGQESELKHTFLTSELAREWPESLSFCSGLHKKLPLAYESAKLLYKAHIRTGSKETIKNLSDLRKTLTDDTQKIVQQSRELASALWKDLALAISTIVIKYAIDSSKGGSDSKLFSYVFLTVSLYLFISQVINLFINHKYFVILESNRSVWREKLYGFLDDDDYIKLSSTPINEASKTYKRVAFITTIISLSLSGLLLYLGISLLYPLHLITNETLEKISNYISLYLI